MENFKNKDYYQILGVNHNTTDKEIKSAYRSLARKYHPDINPGNKLSEKKFKEIGEAYAILGDEKKRKQYNLLRGIKNSSAEEFYNKNTQQNKKQANTAYTEEKNRDTKKKETNKNQSTTKSTNKESSDKKNFNDSFYDFIDSIFKKPKDYENSSKSSKQYEYTPTPIRGEDITTDMTITQIEAINGTVRKINVLNTQACTQCKGRKVVNGYTCTSCNGHGEISLHKKINVKIPPNVVENSKIKIAGEGNRGQNGGVNGDLFIIVHIQKNSIFNFEGNNVICEIPITPSEAALGAEIEVPTIDGIVNMKIPPETHSGQKFRLVGEGLPEQNSNKKGDQLVTTRIEIPKNLSEKEKELYKELAIVRKFNPREKLC